MKKRPVKTTPIAPDVMSWSRQKGGARPADPFQLAQHPPQVTKAAKAARLAMDQDQGLMGGLAWASGISVTGAFHEGLAFLGYPYLAELSQRAEYRRPSEIMAFEMTREWIEFTEKDTEDGDENPDEDDEAAAVEAAKDLAPGEQPPEDVDQQTAEAPDESDEESKDKLADKKRLKSKIAKLEDAAERFKVRDVFRRMLEQDGHFGRGHIYVDTGDGDDADELRTPLALPSGRGNENKVSPDHPLVALRTVEAVWCYPTRYNTNDPLSPDWYKPSQWMVMTRQLHSSRLITFVGREVSDLLKSAYSFGGLSLTQMMKPYVDNWLRGRQSVSDLIHNFSVSGVKTDLSTILQAGVRSLMEKVEFFKNVRDNKGVMVLNKDSEDFFQVNTPLSGLDALQAQMQEHMAAVTGIPIVKLLGIQPAGLNASSEGELQAFYDWIRSYQERLLRDPLTYVLDLIQLSLWGEVDERITFRFKPLRIVEEKAEAERRKLEAEIDDIYVAMGAIDPQEVREKIAHDEDAPYGLINPEDMPEVDTSDQDAAFGQQPGVKPGGSPGSGHVSRDVPGQKEAA